MENFGIELRRKGLLDDDFSDSMPKSFFVLLEGDASAKAVENDRLMPRDGVWSGVRGIRACMALEGMAILRGVTGVAEVQGCMAFDADLHISSRAVSCKSQILSLIDRGR